MEENNKNLKQNPFEVPSEYFEKQEQQFNNAFKESRKTFKPNRIRQLSLAAAVAIILIVAGTFLNSPVKDVVEQDFVLSDDESLEYLIEESLSDDMLYIADNESYDIEFAEIENEYLEAYVIEAIENDDMLLIDN